MGKADVARAKKTLDPYEELGVEKDAKAEKIKRAYRKRAMETHADRGGNDEAFKRVHSSWLILSDAERRRKYDETGEAGDPPIDNGGAAIAGCIAQILGGIMQHFIQREQEPTEQDLAKNLQESLKLTIKGVRDNAEAMDKAAAKMEKALGRFSGPGHELVESILAAQVADLRRQRDGQVSQRKVLEDALEAVKGCQFRSDARRTVFSRDRGTSASTLW